MSFLHVVHTASVQGPLKWFEKYLNCGNRATAVITSLNLLPHTSYQQFSEFDPVKR